MRIVTLIENTPGDPRCACEHGLSLYLETHDHRLLMDTGSTGAFAGESPMVHQEKPQRMLRLFCCTISFGTDSHFAQALVFVSRGLVAKNGCGFVSRGHD